MRKIILAAAIAGAALSLAACAEETEDNAEATMDSMAADAETNMDAMAADAEATLEEGVAETDAALEGVEADLQDETVDEAAVD